MVGATDPAGSRTNFGALLVGYYEGDRLRYAGKVGTGFNAERPAAWFQLAQLETRVAVRRRAAYPPRHPLDASELVARSVC